MELILASASPRRRELLGYFGLPFEIIPAAGPETPPKDADAEGTVRALSLQKARQVAEDHPEALIIGADTVVEIDGVILGTGVSLVGGGAGYEQTCTAVTRVFFREMTDEEIDAYAATGEPMDKAGAYGYQGRAGMYVERIEGDFFNVVGLPLCLLGGMLSEAGVKLH